MDREIETASDLYKKSKYLECIDILENILQKDDNIYAKYLKGLSLFSIGKYTSAKLSLDEVRQNINLGKVSQLELNDEFNKGVVFYNIGIITVKFLTHTRGIDLEEELETYPKEDSTDYLECLDNIKLKRKEKMENGLRIARECFSNAANHFEQSNSIYETALSYNNEGYVYGLLKEYCNAKKSFNNAERFDKSNVIGDIYRNLAFINFKEDVEKTSDEKEKYKINKDAIICFDDQIAKVNSFPWIINTIGYIYNYYKQYDTAITCINQAFKLDPDLAGGYRNKAFSLNSLQNYDQALKYIEKAIYLDSNNYHAWNYKGTFLFNAYIHKEKKRKSTAKDYGTNFFSEVYLRKSIDCFQKAIEINPFGGDEAWNNLGVCILYYSENPEEAIGCFNKCIEITSDNNLLALAYYNKGYVLAKYIHIYDSAKDCFDNCISRTEDPQIKSLAYLNRGYLHGLKQNYDEAKECFQNSRKYNIDFADAYRNEAYTIFKTMQNLDRNLKDYEIKYNNEYNNALYLYQEALNKDYEFSYAWNSLGYFLLRNLDFIIENHLNYKNEKNETQEFKYPQTIGKYNSDIDIIDEDKKKIIFDTCLGCFDKASEDKDFAYPLYNKGYIFYLLGIEAEKKQRQLEQNQVIDKLKFKELDDKKKILFRKADELFDDCLKLKPNLVHAWNNRAVVMIYLERYNEAIEYFDQASRIPKSNFLDEDLDEDQDPQQAHANLFKGYALVSSKRYKESIEYFTKAIYDDSTNDNISYLSYYDKGCAHFYLKEYDKAEESFNSAYEKNKQDNRSLLNIAICHYIEGKDHISELEKLTDESIRAEKNFYIALSYQRDGNITKAEESYMATIESFPSDQLKALVYYNLGVIAHRKNENETAKRMFLKSFKSNPSFVDAEKALVSIDATYKNDFLNYWFEKRINLRDPKTTEKTGNTQSSEKTGNTQSSEKTGNTQSSEKTGNTKSEQSRIQKWVNDLKKTVASPKKETYRSDKSKIKSFVGWTLISILSFIIIIIGIMYILYFRAIIHEPFGVVGLSVLATVLLVIFFLWPNLRGVKILEIELHKDVQPISTIEPLEKLHNIDTKITLMYPLKSFKAPVEPLSMSLNVPLKRLDMPTPYPPNHQILEIKSLKKSSSN